jgi:NAD-dependent deacetylase
MDHQSHIEQLITLVSASRNLVAFTGAGISTASGIPDFRSPTSGLWESVDPLTVASLYGFRQNPQAFYDWIYPLAKTTLAALPNPAHHALFQLEQLGYLQSIITQNIDMLHERAGNRVVHELHGHLRDATCIHCFATYAAPPLLDKFIEYHQIPRCSACNGVIKPNVILFGEQLPITVFQSAQRDARMSDILLVVGSSLEVAPASDIPLIALRNNAKLVIINLEPTAFDPMAHLVIHGNAVEILPKLVAGLEARS